MWSRLSVHEMEALLTVINYFLHIDQHLQAFIVAYGYWVYGLLFVIVFCETGLIITPLLPGDSLLFAAGSLAALGEMNVHGLVVLLIVAAILGDAVNYWVGSFFGDKLFRKEKSWLFNPRYLQQAHAFYAKHGGKAIVIARFVPIIRTFAPFVAGMARMNYAQFFAYNTLGAILWVTSLTYLSYWFGNIPVIKENFGFVVLAIIFVSFLPTFLPWVIGCCRKKIIGSELK